MGAVGTAEKVRSVSLRLRPRVALPVGRSFVIWGVGGLWLAAGLVIAALGVWDTPAPKPEPWWVALVIGGCFIAGEQLMLHVEYRREALTLTLTEVPTALCLVFLDLRTALLVRVATSVIVFILVLGQRYVKVLYNLGVQVFSLAAGFTFFHALVDGKVWGEIGFIWLFFAVSIVTVIDSVLVIVAISVFEGRFFEKLRDEVRSGAPRVFIASVTATLAAGLAVAWPVLAFGLLLPIIGVWKVLRTNVQTTQRLRDLVDVNGLMASLGVTLERDELAQIAVVETQRLLRAERVALFRCDPAAGTLLLVASIGENSDELPTSVTDERWSSLLGERAAVLVGPEVVASFGLRGGNAIVAPVYDDEELVAVLVVSDRHGAAAFFDEADLVRAGTIADRLALALRNAALHEQIQHEAWHDSLTGLPNRIQFERTIDEVLDEGDPTGSIGLLMLGVDRFREVNSTLGHQTGDRVLLELVNRLASGLQPGDVLARLAGDEFGVLIRVDGDEQLLETAHRLVQLAERRLALDEFEVVVTLSVGAVICPDQVSNAAMMLRRADIAMHTAKVAHSSVELYRNDIDRRTPERLSMLGDLRMALEHSHLEVNFQPKVDLASGRVVGAEALVRWNHPQRGMVPPVEFVTLAENTGLITMLTDQVLRKCVSTIRLLNDLGHHLDVSLNLSAIDLLDEKLVGRVERILAENGVPADQLTLEITESALLADGPRSLETAEGLRRLGAHLSIDDFGTGFSSFSYLRVLPASELKVDQSFVTNMLSDARDEVIVRSTIDLGHNLGLQVVAEGVEDMATLERLRVLGCDLVQGFGIAKPMPLDRLLVFLNDGARESSRTAAHPAVASPFQPRVVSAS